MIEKQIMWGIITYIAYMAMLITFSTFRMGQGYAFKEFALFFLTVIALVFSSRKLLVLFGWTPPKSKTAIPTEQTLLNDHLKQ